MATLCLLIVNVLFQYFFPFHSQAEPNIIDSYNCVSIVRQPSLRHPLLRHHKIQYKPNIPALPAVERPRSTMEEGEVTALCPSWKVPIISNPLIRPLSDINSGVKYIAKLSTPRGESTYHGGAALMNIYNPQVNMAQSSRSHIWVQNGPKTQVNSIEAGWAVHPGLYGDNYTRLTTYWTADHFQTTGCYNILCPGFVQIDNLIFLGQAYDMDPSYSTQHIAILQDNVTGNWWLVAGMKSTTTTRAVGYWPKELFTYLTLGAEVVKYGGTASTYVEQLGLPSMGCGKYPAFDFGPFGFYRIQYVNRSFNLIEGEHDQMVKLLNSFCYGLRFYDLGGSKRLSTRFGGRGGPVSICKRPPLPSPPSNYNLKQGLE